MPPGVIGMQQDCILALEPVFPELEATRSFFYAMRDYPRTWLAGASCEDISLKRPEHFRAGRTSIR